ncbi:MAG: hypothetical protein DMG06_02765 [Acidobacteria bacterium]|nr:MAG: hypothetical protein DMG06_02765 [Acidobacteriota bacterium]
MALNKAKVLKSAEKYVVQGKVSHAISEYQKLIKEDPTDLPLVNTLGDLYVRIGNIPEAVKCFTRLAESYDNGGFVVRAIAMYKKVSKIDPAQLQALSRLADLYLRQGLISDARAHYLQVVESLLRKNEVENAISILQRIVEVDPENPAIEGRLAEVCLKLGKKSEAARAFHSAAQKFRRKGSLAEAESHFRKAYELDENNLSVLLNYAGVLNDLGKTDEALSYLNRIQFNDFNPEVHEAIFNVYLKSERLKEAEETATHLVELDSNYYKLSLSLGKSFTERRDFESAVRQIGRVVEIAVEKADGEAVESQLKAILQNDPEHIPTLLELIKFYNLSNTHHNISSLLEQIGNLYVRQDQLLEAASIFTELAKLEPSNPSHRDNLAQIKERLGLKGEEIELPRLVPDMSSIADKFVSEPTLKTIASPVEIEEEVDEEAILQAHGEEQVKGFIVEGDLFSSYGLYQKAIDQYKKVLELIPNHVEIHEKIRDMYAKGGDLPKAAQECLVLANIYAARKDTENANRNFTQAYQYDPNLHQEPIHKATLSESGEVEIHAEPSTVPQKEISSADLKRLQELLEEIDFYFDQGFLAEAKNCIDEYLRMVPADAELLKRLDRYEALSKAQSIGAPSPEIVELMAESENGARRPAEVQIEEFETTSTVPSDVGTGDKRIEPAAGLETTAVAQDAKTTVEPITAAGSSESFEEIMIDLDHELKGPSLESVGKPASSKIQNTAAEPVPASGMDSGLEDIFAEFKLGLEDDDNEVPDFETHYNLGIAFKEMGLLEEAIAEFQRALRGQSPSGNGEEFVKCCNMLGLCFVEKGLPQVAVKWFTKGLSSPGRDEETYLALRYDLGCAHQQAGQTKAALDTFLEVYGANVNYRDVAEKIENLKKSR